MAEFLDEPPVPKEASWVTAAFAIYVSAIALAAVIGVTVLFALERRRRHDRERTGRMAGNRRLQIVVSVVTSLFFVLLFAWAFREYVNRAVRPGDRLDDRDGTESGGGRSGKPLGSVELGKLLFDSKGCATCHSLDGSRKTGPSLLGVYGASVRLSGGKTVTADDNYLRESIIEPRAKLVQGYDPVMPAFAGQLDDKQVNALIEFIKSTKR